MRCSIGILVRGCFLPFAVRVSALRIQTYCWLLYPCVRGLARTQYPLPMVDLWHLRMRTGSAARV